MSRLSIRGLRAARLVVDTGLHGLGWSRGRALALLRATVPLPEAALAAEVDRYLALPGQALAYWTGYEELLRLRSEVQAWVAASPRR